MSVDRTIIEGPLEWQEWRAMRRQMVERGLPRPRGSFDAAGRPQDPLVIGGYWGYSRHRVMNYVGPDPLHQSVEPEETHGTTAT